MRKYRTFSLSGKNSNSEGYLAFGLPTTSSMGPAPVFICSSALENKTSLQWNTDDYDSVTIEYSSFHLLENFKDENGIIECQFRIPSNFEIEVEGKIMKFDLNRESFAVIVASGKNSNKKIWYVFKVQLY